MHAFDGAMGVIGIINHRREMGSGEVSYGKMFEEGSSTYDTDGCHGFASNQMWPDGVQA